MDTDDLVREIQKHLPMATTWAYIAIWGVSEMILRKRKNPTNPQFNEILFPHTSVPLFTRNQAKQLEGVWPAWITDLTVNPVGTEDDTGATPKSQHGGYTFPPTLKQLSAGPTAAGKVMAATLQNPELLSIDAKFEEITKSLDSWDDAIMDAAKQYGLPAIEEVTPDPKVVIPLPVPIVMYIPTRVILPTLNAILELVRVATTFLPPMEILGKPVTILMVFLDLARGNLYHAIFTLLGILGKYPMYGGILLKILRDAYMLIAPDIRSDLRSALFRSGKSFTVGWIIWLFGILAPDLIRQQIKRLLDKVRNMIDKFNDVATKAEVRATAALKGFGKVELPKIPSSHIPTIGDLYILQEYVHNPNIYCHPEVAPMLAEMRSIPPLVLFFDLLNIPAAGSAQFERECAKVATTPLTEQFAPKITLNTPSMPTAQTEISAPLATKI